MSRFIAAIAFVGCGLVAGSAFAQPQPVPSPAAPAAASPDAPAPVAPPASPLTPPPGEGTGLTPPPQAPPYGYGPAGNPGYGTYPGGYGYAPPPGPPPLQLEPATRCCRWSIRYNPFDLINRRASFEAEVAVAGPFALEFDPSWIFGTSTDGLDEKGVELGGRAVFYIFGKPMRGFWVKAHASYERYDATYTNPATPNDPKLKASKTLGSAILGALIGSSWVIGKDGGFTLSGGVGVGATTAAQTSIVAPGDATRNVAPAQIDFYDKSDRVRLLGSLALGATF
jgi:hypothetical protein